MCPERKVGTLKKVASCQTIASDMEDPNRMLSYVQHLKRPEKIDATRVFRRVAKQFTINPS